MYRIFALALLLIAAGCGGAKEPTPVDRPALLAAFAAIDEPLTLRLDMLRADPDSVVDAIFVPASDDVPDSPVEISLFDNEDGARTTAASVKQMAGGKAQVVLYKNTSILLSRSVARERRDLTGPRSSVHSL